MQQVYVIANAQRNSQASSSIRKMESTPIKSPQEGADSFLPHITDKNGREMERKHIEERNRPCCMDQIPATIPLPIHVYDTIAYNYTIPGYVAEKHNDTGVSYADALSVLLWGNGCVTLFHLDNHGEKSAWHECTRPNQSVRPHTWSSLLCALKTLQHYSDIEHKFRYISPSHRCYHHHNHNHSDNHYGEYSGTRFHFHIFNQQQIFWVTSCL